MYFSACLDSVFPWEETSSLHIEEKYTEARGKLQNAAKKPLATQLQEG